MDDPPFTPQESI